MNDGILSMYDVTVLDCVRIFLVSNDIEKGKEDSIQYNTNWFVASNNINKRDGRTQYTIRLTGMIMYNIP